jgi:hypothetical protein
LYNVRWRFDWSPSSFSLRTGWGGNQPSTSNSFCIL